MKKENKAQIKLDPMSHGQLMTEAGAVQTS